MTARLVTVLIPAYRPDRIIQTLDSLARQEFREFRVRIGLDPSSGYTMPHLPFADLDLEIVQHPSRLGWVGNVNALLETVDTPYFVIVAHDDGLSPDFLKAAVRALEGAPDAVVAHGTTEHRGVVRAGELATTASIRGTPFERIQEYIKRGPDRAELGWRGLIRRALLPEVPRLRTRLSDGQFSNTLFSLELLLFGNSIFVEDIRYIKDTGPAGLSRELVGRPANEKSAMLADNLACLAVALAEAGDRLSPAERETLLAAYAHWLLMLQGTWNVLADESDSGSRPFHELREPVARFVARALLSSVAEEPGHPG